MVSAILVPIGAIFNALMDNIQTRIAFNVSIFKDKDPTFWCKEDAGNSKHFIRFTKYRADAWHLSKSFMLMFLILSIVFYTPIFNKYLIDIGIWGKIIDFFLLGEEWILVFNHFFNKRFKDKEYLKTL